jgi:ABC-type multidrug transport system permease subunit
MWYDLILFVLSATGLAYGITISNLLKPLREKVSEINQVKNSIERKNLFVWYLDGLLNCVYCCAFWTSILAYLCIYVYDMSYLCYPFIGALGAKTIYQLIKPK